MSDIKPLLDALRDRPLDFYKDLYTFKDRKTNAEYWIANGFWFYGLHRPAEFTFSFLDKLRFSKALREWGKRVLEIKNAEALKD